MCSQAKQNNDLKPAINKNMLLCPQEDGLLVMFYGWKSSAFKRMINNWDSSAFKRMIYGWNSSLKGYFTVGTVPSRGKFTVGTLPSRG